MYLTQSGKIAASQNIKVDEILSKCMPHIWNPFPDEVALRQKSPSKSTDKIIEHTGAAPMSVPAHLEEGNDAHIQGIICTKCHLKEEI
jgi:hypothetical protein